MISWFHMIGNQWFDSYHWGSAGFIWSAINDWVHIIDDQLWVFLRLVISDWVHITDDQQSVSYDWWSTIGFTSLMFSGWLHMVDDWWSTIRLISLMIIRWSHMICKVIGFISLVHSYYRPFEYKSIKSSSEDVYSVDTVPDLGNVFRSKLSRWSMDVIGMEMGGVAPWQPAIGTAVYPGKYGHGLVWIFWCGYIDKFWWIYKIHLPISFRATSQTLGQS